MWFLSPLFSVAPPLLLMNTPHQKSSIAVPWGTRSGSIVVGLLPAMFRECSSTPCDLSIVRSETSFSGDVPNHTLLLPNMKFPLMMRISVFHFVTGHLGELFYNRKPCTGSSPVHPLIFTGWYHSSGMLQQLKIRISQGFQSIWGRVCAADIANVGRWAQFQRWWKTSRIVFFFCIWQFSGELIWEELDNYGNMMEISHEYGVMFYITFDMHEVHMLVHHPPR